MSTVRAAAVTLLAALALFAASARAADPSCDSVASIGVATMTADGAITCAPLAAAGIDRGRYADLSPRRLEI
jgi:hypothetical protein